MSTLTCKPTAVRVTLELPGQEPWEFSLLDMIRKTNDVLERCKADGKTNFEHLDEIAALVNSPEVGGPLMTADEADDFLDWINEEYVVAKKNKRDKSNARLSAIDGKPTSPPSTASTPSG